MNAVPYLGFKDNCRAAFEFYHQVLGGDIVAMYPMGAMPGGEEMPAEVKDLIMHARLVSDGVTLMGSDACNGQYSAPQGISVSLHVDEPAEADRIYAALSEGGHVIMPIDETFWALRFAMFVDQFGTPWMINCEKPFNPGQQGG